MCGCGFRQKTRRGSTGHVWNSAPRCFTEDAWNRQVQSAMFEVPVYFISREDLISNKLAAGCFTDLEDVRRLDAKS